MKIAVVTDNGKTISERFGRATLFLVLTIEDGRITRREPRRKLGRSPLPGHPQGSGSPVRDQLARMAEVIADCQVVICGGAEPEACKSLEDLGIKHVLTDIKDIDQAVKDYLEHTIADPAVGRQ